MRGFDRLHNTDKADHYINTGLVGPCLGVIFHVEEAGNYQRPGK